MKAKVIPETPRKPPAPPKRILVPVDFSPLSTRAVEYARSFARQFRAQVSIIHVVEAFPIDYIVGLESMKAAKFYLIKEARTRVRQTARLFASAGRTAADSCVAYGKPYREIVKAAKQMDANLILLSTHGRTGWKRIELGSTAERVVRHANCPVLVVRGPMMAATARKPPRAVSPRKILVPIDFSPRSRMALDYALPIARRFHARIVLLHVIPDNAFPHPQLMDAFYQAGKTQLADVARSIPNTFETMSLIKNGHPGYSIIGIADKLRIDLIIMSTHGRTGLKRVVLGSTAEFVVRHAGCPVLTIRQVG